MDPSTTTASSTHGHHFILTNPFSHSQEVDEDEHVGAKRANASTPNPPTTPATGGFWGHIMPRHAYFHVKIIIHQLANIPLVSGDYSAQWKFKSVHSLPTNKSNGPGLLSTIVKKKTGKGKEKDAGAAESHNHEHDDTDDTGSMNSSENHHGSVSSEHTSSSSSSSGPATTPVATAFAPSVSSWPSSAPSASTIYPPPNTPGRGQTQFIKLRDHNVKWEHTLSTIVRMDIERDPASPMLLSTPFKLEIMQRDSSYRSDKSGTHSSTTTKPFGNVTLDLAQYASKGDVTRQYLLRESKTNATLKLTTTITHIPHTTPSSALPSAPSAPSVGSSLTINLPSPSFIAPPLPSGEILAGISNIKTRGLNLGGEADVYRTRPRGLDLYGPYYDQEELEMDLMGGVRQKGGRSKAGTTGNFGPKFIHVHDLSNGTHGRARSHSGPSFDPSRLPLAYGAKTTEALIDAIFNPVPTRDKRRESPFTVYVPPTPSSPSSAGAAGAGAAVATPGSGVASGSATSATGGSKETSATAGAFPTSISEPVLSPGASSKKSPRSIMSQPSRSHSKRPQPARAQSSGIGAGLGIMGLGMGLGVGLGAQVSISPHSADGTRKSMEVGGRLSSSGGGEGRMSLDVPGRQVSRDGRVVGDVKSPEDSGKRWWRLGRSRPGTPVPAA